MVNVGSQISQTRLSAAENNTSGNKVQVREQERGKMGEERWRGK